MVESSQARVKWYYGIAGVLFLLACLGPLALSFLWRSPRFSLAIKWILTLGMIVLTIYLCITSVHLIQTIKEAIQLLGG